MWNSQSPAWELPYPFDLVALDPHDDSTWIALAARYAREDEPAGPAKGSDRPLLRCLEVVRENGAKTAIIETRYIDIDYRSEYSAFYSRAFAHHLDSTQRVHFFQDELDADDVWRLPRVQDSARYAVQYLGYMVVRPPPIRGVVGRTMLAPPASLKEAVRTAVPQVVNFFGQDLKVRAAPFIQQESRLGSCAHAASWMCHVSAFLGKRQVSRQPVAEFSAAVNPGLGLGRLLPSTGLTLHQISQVLGAFGMPPIHYEVEKLSDSDRPQQWPNRHIGRQAQVARVLCRNLNSGLPVLVVVRQLPGEGLHALTVCGYERDDACKGGVRLVVHDDRRGPYLIATDVENDVDTHGGATYQWEHLLAPAPEKLWLNGEAAERKGSEHLLLAARRVIDDPAYPSDAQVIQTLFDKKQLTLRTYAITANRFKARMRKNAPDDVVAEAYSYARLPRYVWVVEAIDRVKRDNGEPSVWGEVVIDATSDELNPQFLAVRLPGLIAVPQPEQPNWDALTASTAIHSSGQYNP